MLRRKHDRHRRIGTRSRTWGAGSRLRRARPLRLENLEQRQLLAATPMGVTPEDTGEFLLGTVAVTPVFFESNGGIDSETQNWTTEEIDQVLAKLTEGVNWWAEMLDTLDTVHSLEFVIDDTFAIDPVETPYEPIDRSSSAFNLYVGDFVTSQGYGEASSIEDAVKQFNHAQRMRLGTDWSFTIFVVDSSDDADGLFASGGPRDFAAAFAFAGGLFYITPSTRPASTFAHEMGHIFWGRDEYSGGGSWEDRRGYYDAQNLNAYDNPTPGFEQQVSIMRGGVPLTAAYETFVSPESTLAMVGWRDSDGDGVFDLADVPLELDGSGYFDAQSSIYYFSATASAVPRMNQNSSGPQSDITLNRISQLQYQLGDGPWQVAAEPDRQVAQFDLAIPIQDPFSTIRWRVIDLATGITSPVIEGTAISPAMSQSSITGLAFMDENGDGQRAPFEPGLALTEVVVRHRDGSSLLAGEVAAADQPGQLLRELAGVTLAADGIVFDPDVGSFPSAELGDRDVFQSFDQQRSRWIERWSSKVALQATFDEPVGVVSLEAIGVSEQGFARIAAYDAEGQLLGRSTSEAIGLGQSVRVEVTDPLGRIASIRAFGHAGTAVGLDDLRFGSGQVVSTDDGGSWRLQNLPEGAYTVGLVPDRVIHQFDQPEIEVNVVAGTSPMIVAPARRVDSPRYNRQLAEDANNDGIVTSRDALVIINDLDRFQPRVLQPSETDGFDVDVSNDGVVSALDALLVINRLGRDQGPESEDVSLAADAIASDSLWAGLSAEQVSPMLNSAGGTAPDKSSGRSSADIHNQSLIGPDRLASKIQKFPSVLLANACDDSNQSELDPANADQPDLLSDLIQPKNSEPFGLRVI